MKKLIMITLLAILFANCKKEENVKVDDEKIIYIENFTNKENVKNNNNPLIDLGNGNKALDINRHNLSKFYKELNYTLKPGQILYMEIRHRIRTNDIVDFGDYWHLFFLNSSNLYYNNHNIKGGLNTYAMNNLSEKSTDGFVINRFQYTRLTQDLKSFTINSVGMEGQIQFSIPTALNDIHIWVDYIKYYTKEI